jgi:hypothetical protein
MEKKVRGRSCIRERIARRRVCDPQTTSAVNLSTLDNLVNAIPITAGVIIAAVQSVELST